MASISDRLHRQRWDPQPGDELIGTIVSIQDRDGAYGWYPLFVVEQDDTSKEYTVNGSRGGILEDILAVRPKVGDRIGFGFHGPVEKLNGSGTWDKYTVAFEEETTSEPDWDRMAKSREVRGRKDKTDPVPEDPPDPPF